MPDLDDAAKGGDSNAQFNLGILYETGKERPRDYAAAARWHRKAAMGGHRGAQYCLALMYAKGQGVAKSDRISAEWYRRAAGAGHQGAQFNLASIYEHGVGVDRDILMAYVWFTLAGMRIVSSGAPEKNRSSISERMVRAAVNKNSAATLHRNRLAVRLSETDRFRAEDLVRSLWSEAHPIGPESIVED